MRALVLLLLLPVAVTAQPAPDPEQLERLNAAIAQVQDALASTRGERNTVYAEVLDLERDIAGIRAEITTVQQSIATEQARLAALETERSAREAERDAQQALIASYLKNAWQGGKQAGLKLLLNQDDPLQSARLLRYYRYFSAARAEQIAAFEQTLAQLAEVAIAITASRTTLETRAAELAASEDALAASLQQREASIAHLDTELDTQGSELQRLQDEKIELQILLEELRQSLANLVPEEDMEPFAKRKGQLPWPLDGRVLQAYGSRHSLGDLTMEGITLAGSAGADIHAIHHGRVVFADWFNTSGLLLIIDHGDGYMSLYAHNQELYKAVGDWVFSGEAIAAVGNTGGQREFGLYFEIRHNGKAENPAQWCVAR